MERGLDMAMLQRMMGGPALAQEKKPPVIEPLNIEGIVARINRIKNSADKRKIIVMTGAGISTAAGIPDFRSPGTGLYDNLQRYNLPRPEAVFEIQYFMDNPKPFYDLAKELYPEKFKPTMSHYFIRLLQDEGLLLRAYTQNIDTLERRAGIQDGYIVEAHGAFNTAHCVSCGESYPSDKLKEKVFKNELPMCERDGCAYIPPDDLLETEAYKGLVKPDIVFFGEALPERFAELVVQDLPQCELLIIMGTSLKVHPFASLVNRVPDDCPRCLINLEMVGEVDPIMAILMGRGGMDFSEETGYRDVFLQDTCDNGVLKLAGLLGLEEKLRKMFDEEHARLDTEISAMMATLSVEDSRDSSAQDKPEVEPMDSNKPLETSQVMDSQPSIERESPLVEVAPQTSSVADTNEQVNPVN